MMFCRWESLIEESCSVNVEVAVINWSSRGFVFALAKIKQPILCKMAQFRVQSDCWMPL